MTANEEQAIKHGAHTENDILNAMPCAVIFFVQEEDGHFLPVYRNHWYDEFFGCADVTEAELGDTFFGWFYPGDLPQVMAMLRASAQGEAGEEICRVSLDDGRVVWIDARSWSMEAGEDGRVRVGLTFIDLAKAQARAGIQSAQEERYQTLAKYTNSMCYDYDVLKDTMFFVHLTPDGTPKERNMEYFLESLPSTRYVHSSTIREFSNALKGNRSGDNVDFLLKGDDGDYHWCRAYYRPVTIGQNKAFHMVGRVELAPDDLHQTALLQMDKVTGILDRVSTDLTIKHIIEDKEDKSRKALISFRLEGLDAIDETMGFDVGNRVLRAVGRLIAENLRGSDVVGRYSGTMFTTLIRDAEDKAAVEKTVNHIKDRARAAEEEMHLTSPIKLSAGIVYIPEKGRILTLLLKAAMEALPQLHSDNETTAK